MTPHASLRILAVIALASTLLTSCSPSSPVHAASSSDNSRKAAPGFSLTNANGASVKLSNYGSPQEFVRSGILRGFPDLLKSDVFGVGHGHAPGFQQEVAQVLISAATVDQHTNVAIDSFHHAKADFGPAIVQNPFQVFEQHLRELLKGGQALPA